MDKTTYSTDTTAAAPSANLSAARQYLAATGTSTAGYFGGGVGPGSPSMKSIMDKVTYSTDTIEAVPGANLSYGRSYLAATGNSTHGYFGGGGQPGTPGQLSIMDKITYSTDTTAPLPGSPLSLARYYHGATGNSTHGYFGGGYSPAAVSTMDKITYSTDSIGALPASPLSDARYGATATSSSTAGYFGGGFPGPGPMTTMDKITYSTDSIGAVSGAALNVARYITGASSARSNALPQPTATLPNIV